MSGFISAVEEGGLGESEPTKLIKWSKVSFVSKPIKEGTLAD